MSDTDIFYLEKTFPEPDKVFGFEYKSLDDLITDCVVVLDTNVLFVPFDTSEKNLDEIKSIFLTLKNHDRLFLPARVVREFANNRAKRLGDLFLKIRQTKNNLNTGNFKIQDYPLLQGNESYQEILSNYKKIIDAIKASRKLLDKVESDILSWNWDDNVSRTYKEIFTNEIIKEVSMSEEDLKKSLQFRIKHKIAPGYKDSGKPDDGIGDLIVWQTALEIAKEKGKDLILVSNDQKNDWFYKQDRKGLYPKYELFDEFRRFTNGKSMQIITFPKFLELMHATPETVKEIKESIRNSDEDDFNYDFDEEKLVVGMRIEHKRFGLGTITEIIREPNRNSKFKVDFDKYGVKFLLIRFAAIKILKNSHNFLLMHPDFDGDPRSYQLLDIDDD